MLGLAEEHDVLRLCLRRLVPLQHVVEPRAVLAPDWSVGRSARQLVGRCKQRRDVSSENQARSEKHRDLLLYVHHIKQI